MTVGVADSVGAEIFGDLAEQQFTLGRIPGARDTTRRVDDDRPVAGDESALDERRQRDEDRCWIAAGVRNDAGARYERTVQLRQAVRNPLAPIAGTQVRG
jgi:hypothetical protein